MSLRSRLLPPVALSLAACLAGAATAGAAVLSPDTTWILSGTPSLLTPFPAPVADSFAGRQSVSKDGSVVAFASSSDGLSGEDDDGVENVYVKDMRTGVVTLVSRRSGAGGAAADDFCQDPAISDDGQRVAFDCSGPLDPADTNGSRDVYVRDLRNGQTILVSRQSGAAGAVGAGSSFAPALDRDGTHVAFASSADNLDGTLGDQEVFVRDVPLDPQHSSDGTVTLVSRPDETTGQTRPSGGFSSGLSISDDGTKVAFLSNDRNLVTVSATTAIRTQVFVRTLGPAPKTELVSRSTAGEIANDDASDAMIGGDGTAVAFTSEATNLDPANATVNHHDVYVRTLGATPTTTLVDRASDGAKADNGASAAAIDDDGTTVAFRTNATNLDPAADPNRSLDVYVAELGGAAPVVTLASRAGAAGPAANAIAGLPSLSGDGTQVLLETVGSLTGDAVPRVRSLALRTLASGAMAGVSRPGLGATFDNQGGSAAFSSISADGRYVAMQTNAPALGVPPGARGAIVVRDTHSGAIVLASRADGPGGAPLTNEVLEPSISADGRRVAFAAYGELGNTKSAQVWVRDLAAGRTILVSRADGAAGAPANDFTADPSISADGTRVAFLSNATNLSPDDGDPSSDVYVRDLAKGTTVLADRADGPAGAKGDGAVFSARLSGDGMHVAFDTAARNLGDGAAGDVVAVHIRDLARGTTHLVSVATDGKDGNDDAALAGSESASISADGSRVAFESRSTNLGTAIPADGSRAFSQVWVRDLAAGRTILASRADGSGGAPSAGGAFGGILSADGRIVSFYAANANLTGIVPPSAETYRRDLVAGTTRLVSRSSGRTGAPAPHNAFPLALTADGGCVMFTAGSDLLGQASGTRDYPQAYLRVLEANCGVRPVLGSVALSHARFRVGKTRTAVAAAKKKAARKKRKPIPRGTVLRFTSSEAAKLSIKIERVRPGHKVKVGKGKSRKTVCKPARKRVKRGRCTVYTRVATLTRKIKTGRGRVALSGRIGKKAMAPGSYRLTLTARDAAGAVSTATRRSFTITRG